MRSVQTISSPNASLARPSKVFWGEVLLLLLLLLLLFLLMVLLFGFNGAVGSSGKPDFGVCGDWGESVKEELVEENDTTLRLLRGRAFLFTWRHSSCFPFLSQFPQGEPPSHLSFLVRQRIQEWLIISTTTNLDEREVRSEQCRRTHGLKKVPCNGQRRIRTLVVGEGDKQKPFLWSCLISKRNRVVIHFQCYIRYFFLFLLPPFCIHLDGFLDYRKFGLSDFCLEIKKAGKKEKETYT